MCGIAGVITSGSDSVEQSILKRMCDSMLHRGPDDEGYYFGNSRAASIGLGHRRLAIIDLNTGHQPIHNENKKIWVINNGEIYNFIELRKSLEEKGHIFYTHSDTEVIVHAYEEYGDDVAKHLSGMFAFAIWDSIQGRLILGRDRLGKKPLLYAHLGNSFIFASEFKAILAHPEIRKEIDFEAIHHYLTYLCIPAPLTAFKKIRKLLPGHTLSYQDGSLRLSNYWEPDFSKKIKIDETEAIEQIIAHLKEAVKKRLISDVPLGVLLSGGIDSSCVAAFMSRLAGNRINTFSVGFRESQFNELSYAKLIAERFSTNHHQDYVTANASDVLPELVERYGEPYADSSALPTYYLCKAASKEVKVALSGDGGDEVFAGYRRHLACHLAENYSPFVRLINRTPLKLFFSVFSDRPAELRSPGNIKRFLSAAELNRANRHMRWIGFFDEGFKKMLYTDEFSRQIQSLHLNSSTFMEDLFNKAGNLDSIDAALYVDMLFGLQSDLLVKMDIASMANSMEVRSPLLDEHLIEFSASLPSAFKIHNFSLKYIFKKSLKGLLPDEILKRPKKGFAVPVDKWFRDSLKDYLFDVIMSPRALGRGYFREDSLRKVIKTHLSGKNNYGQHLWGLLFLELWHRKFIDT